MPRSLSHHPLWIIGSLSLLIGAANVGIAARLYRPDRLGQAIFITTRVLLVVLPMLWVRGVERHPFTWSPPQRSDWRLGLGLGSAMAIAILAAYGWQGQQWIDPAVVQARAAAVGLGQPWRYLAGAAYFCLINAAVEEYIWRWFVGRQWRALVGKTGAIAAAAGSFTLHHIIALVGYTADLRVVVLGAIGVFLAGGIWSACYQYTGRLWVSVISHVVADLGLAIVGWQILFGR